MNKISLLAALLTIGCATAAYPPRGVVTRQDRNGGSIALYNEDDVEPSQHLARRDAERQMAEHCGPRGYEIVSQDRYDTGNSVSVHQGFGVHTQQRVTVKQLNYVCK